MVTEQHRETGTHCKSSVHHQAFFSSADHIFPPNLHKALSYLCCPCFACSNLYSAVGLWVKLSPLTPWKELGAPNPHPALLSEVQKDTTTTSTVLKHLGPPATSVRDLRSSSVLEKFKGTFWPSKIHTYCVFIRKGNSHKKKVIMISQGG